MAPSSVSVADPVFEARAANWIYSNHNRRAEEAREIVSCHPARLSSPLSPLPPSFTFLRSPFSLGSQSVDCLARQPTRDTIPAMPGRFLGPHPSLYKTRGNLIIVRFRFVARERRISTPVEQTRFLSLIKLSRAATAAAQPTTAVAWLSQAVRLACHITSKKLGAIRPSCFESGLDRLRPHPTGTHNVVCDYVVVSLNPEVLTTFHAKPRSVSYSHALLRKT